MQQKAFLKPTISIIVRMKQQSKSLNTRVDASDRPLPKSERDCGSYDSEDGSPTKAQLID